jgi:CRP/FNR family cyclic AMP-dependent transcriptional regulator
LIQHNPDTQRFKEEMRRSLKREARNSRAINIVKRDHVYSVGEAVGSVYFIEKGKIKLVMLSTSGRECMLAIHTAGDIFGEICLSGRPGRLETATAMEDTVLKQVPCGKFLERLSKDSLLEGFIKYLAVRVADHRKSSPIW